MKKSILSYITLEFDNKEAEQRYRQAYLQTDLKQNRIVILFALVANIIFMVPDYLLNATNQQFWNLFYLRSFFMFACVTAFFLLLKLKKESSHDYIIYVWMIIVVLFIAYIKSTRPPEYIYPYILDIVVIIAAYALVLNRAIFQAIPAITLSIIILVQLHQVKAYIDADFIAVVMIVVLVNIFGIILARQFQDYRRKEYLQKHELADLAHTDPLTSLHNRRYFYTQAQGEFSRVSRYGGFFSLLIIDIDLFKKINDKYGHTIGDEYLKVFSRLLENSCRELDTLVRYGGEEFVILLPQTNGDNAEALAQRIKKSAQGIFVKDSGIKHPFSVSIGVTSLQENDTTIEQIIMRADEALYLAKQSGRNCVRVSK